jgi:hypothetical protein
MHYRLIEKSSRPYARKYLETVYELCNGDVVEQYGCVPNGEIGISVVLNGNGAILQHGEWKIQPAVSIYGLVKQVQFHRMSPHYREINLGFSPQYLQLFLKDRMHALEQQSATDLSLLLPATATDKLYETLATALSDEAILDVIELFTISRKRSASRHTPIFPTSSSLSIFTILVAGTAIALPEIF